MNEDRRTVPGARGHGFVLLSHSENVVTRTGPEVLNFFPCSTQLSMIFFLLVNVKMPTIVGILTFMSGKIAF